MRTRTTDNPAWISEICREFSLASGWPVQFAVNDGRGGEALKAELENNGECCWSIEIGSEDELQGILHIDLAQDPRLDHSFLAVCDLGNIFARLINRTLAVGRSRAALTQDVATWVNVSLTDPQEGDLTTALQVALKAATTLTGFRAAALMLLSKNRDELILRTTHALSRAEFPQPRRLLRNSIPDMKTLEENPVFLSAAETPQLRNWIPAGYSVGYCVPVQSSAGPLGTIWTFDRRERIPAESDRRVLQSLALRIAAVLERVVLLRESDVQHRQQRDLNVASNSLPQDILRGISRNSGVDVAAICTSRYELGGDLCELIALDDVRTIVAIGDASGDSVPAAMVMSAVRGAIRALCNSGEFDVLECDAVIGRLNRTLYEITAAHQFMSLLFGILDRRESTFTYTNAGHPPPLLIRGSQVTELKSHGMLLGVLAETDYGRSVVPLQAGDTLIAFSDGISEAMNPKRTMFRQDGIVAAAMPVEQRTAEQLLKAILQELESHTAGSGSGDDRTLLVMRMKGEG